MEHYPRTLLEFEERFATEEACREYLPRLRWPEAGAVEALDETTTYSMNKSQADSPNRELPRNVME